MKGFSHFARIRRPGAVLFPSAQDYHQVLELQRKLCQARLEARRPDTLLLVEHSSVFTLGRRTKPEHWGGNQEFLRQMGYEVYEIERGGSVTYHGPGQLVAYPILRLRDICPGPKVYVWLLEEVLIRVLDEWGIQARRVEKLPGVWVSHDTPPLTLTLSRPAGEGKRMETGFLTENLQKIAAVGVRIARGITMHGVALNVNVDLKPFELITPCGIEGCQVTSMEKALHQPVAMEKVQERIIHHFGEVFGLEWEI